MEIDFTSFKDFSSCPAWWRNLVTDATKDLPLQDPEWSNAIVAALQKYDAEMDDIDSWIFNHVTFRDDTGFLACVLRWDYEDGR